VRSPLVGAKFAIEFKTVRDRKSNPISSTVDPPPSSAFCPLSSALSENATCGLDFIRLADVTAGDVRSIRRPKIIDYRRVAHSRDAIRMCKGVLRGW
jgi:hypothetical protein